MGHLGFVARSDWRYLVAHAREHDEPDLVLRVDEPDRGLEPGVEPGQQRGLGEGAGNYYMSATERGEPAGRWYGPGAELLGFEAGQEVSAASMERVFGALVDPVTGESLGSRPRKFADFETRLQRLLDAEPHADPERQGELRFAARSNQREAAHYYDLTFSPTKSWSVLYAGLKAAGRDEEAGVLWSCLEEGYQAGMGEALEEHGFVRTGRHCGAIGADGRSAGEWQKARGWTYTLFAHHTSRAGDPQLHLHGAVLNRARAVNADGEEAWYAIDGRAIKNARRAAAASMSRISEALAAERLGLSFVDRPDGLGREIAGVSPVLCEHFSSRRRAIEPRVQRTASAYREAYGKEPSAYDLRLMAEQATLQTRERKPEPATGAELLRSWEDGVRTRLGQSLADVPDAAGARLITQVGAEHAQPGEAQRERVTQVEHAQSAQPETSAQGVEHAAAQVEHPVGSAEWITAAVGGPAARDQLVAQALADVGGRQATFGRADVAAALDRHLPAGTLAAVPATAQPALLAGLTDAALAHPDTVLLSVAPLIPAPDAWRRLGEGEDGRGRHEAPTAYDRHTLATTLSREARLVEASQQGGAPAAEAERVAALLEITTLRPGQRAAVEAVLTSGRAVDVLIGPAGTGKSYTVGELARLWAETIPTAGAQVSAQAVGSDPGERAEAGGRPRVLGLATSEAATRVLHGDGITRTMNVEAFLGTCKRVQAGAPVSAAGRELATLRAGDLVVLDEASMTSTPDIEAVAAAARVAGAKLVLAGDDRQLGAVEAGGALALLAERTRPVQLDDVVRFQNGWEGPASLRLRGGDVSVIGEYDRRGRVIAGGTEELTGRATRGFLADHLSGRSSLVITRTNEHAAELSSHIRAQLVDLGRVEPAGVRLRDDTRAGVGDLIAARHNDRTLGDGAGGWVANRDTYRVTARAEDGALTVVRDLGPDDVGSRRWGSPVALPADYVAEHVDLAYAGTVHAAQGRTVDTCYPIIDAATGPDALYVAATRARERTLLLVVTEPEAIDALGQQNPDQPELTAEGVLAGIIDRPHEIASATQALAAEVDARESLARLGPEWTALVTRDAHTRYADALEDLLGEQRWAQVKADPACGAMLLAIRATELDQNLDHVQVGALLDRAVNARELDTADSVAEVLHYRITHERHPNGAALRNDGATEAYVARDSFTARTPRLADPELDGYAQAIAAALDERTAVLGDRAAAEPPAWAIAAFGPVPEDPAVRAEWTTRAGMVAGYREQHSYTHDTNPIGPAPHTSAADQHAHWHAAWTALGRPDEHREVAALTDGELANRIQEWERREAIAPANVDEQLRVTAQAAHRWDTEARYRHAAGTGEPDAARAGEAAEYRDAAEIAGARLAQLEHAAQARSEWHQVTEADRHAARLARAELDRRGTDRAADHVQARAGGERGAETPEPERQLATVAATAQVEQARVDQGSPALATSQRPDPGTETPAVEAPAEGAAAKERAGSEHAARRAANTARRAELAREAEGRAARAKAEQEAARQAVPEQETSRRTAARQEADRRVREERESYDEPGIDRGRGLGL